jgi:hypothetical protein
MSSHCELRRFSKNALFILNITGNGRRVEFQTIETIFLLTSEDRNFLAIFNQKIEISLKTEKDKKRTFDHLIKDAKSFGLLFS